MQKEQQTRTDSEILLKLMMGYRNGGQPDGEELTLWECLRLYRRLIEEEARASGKKEQQKESQKPQEIPRNEAKAKEPKGETFRGNGGGEKKMIAERLDAWLDQGGKAWVLAQHSGGKLTGDEIRMMRARDKLPMEKWKALGAALDSVEAHRRSEENAQ